MRINNTCNYHEYEHDITHTIKKKNKNRIKFYTHYLEILGNWYHEFVYWVGREGSPYRS